MKIHSSVLELIGNTPLVEVKNIEKNDHLDARVVVKIESGNPGVYGYNSIDALLFKEM